MRKNSLLYHLKHMPDAFMFSMQGLKVAVTTETPFIQETVALVALPLVGWAAGVPPLMLLLVVAFWLVVMAVELLNMAIEQVCNLVSPDFNPLVKVAKDAGSAAVLLVMLGNACFWVYLACTYVF